METESKSKSSEETRAKQNAEKPLSLAPLSTSEALRGLLRVKPVKGVAITKASKKRTAKKAVSKT